MLKKLSLKRGTQGIRAAAVIQFSSTYVNVGISLVITMVLSRLLTPDEYGTMAIVGVFVGMFSILSNVGIGAAVIQFRELTDRDCSGLFTFSTLFGFVLAAVFCLLSFPVSFLYADERLIPLMCIVSIGVLASSMNMVPNGMLIRDKKFLAVGMRLIMCSIVSGALAIVLAINGFGVYALALNSVFSSVFILVWNLLASDLKIGNVHFMAPLKTIFSFSSLQFLSQFLQYIIRNADNLLIGLFLGSVPLGMYDKSYKLAKYPIEMIPQVLNPVVKSFFSSAEGDKDKIYDLFYKVEKVLSITGFFFSAVCFCCAEELILLFFGDQWGDAVIPFKLLSICIAFQMMNSMVFPVLEGLRRTDLLLKHTVVTSITMLSLLAIGLYFGSLALVAGLISLYFVLSSVPFTYFVVRKAFGFSVGRYLKGFVPEAISAVVVVAVLQIVQGLLPDIIIGSFAIKVAIAAALYSVLLWRTGQLGYLRMLIKRPSASGDNTERCRTS